MSNQEFSAYVGLDERDAYALAEAHGKKCQTTERDGKYVPRPDHTWPGRLNFVVVDGTVTEVSEE